MIEKKILRPNVRFKKGFPNIWKKNRDFMSILDQFLGVFLFFHLLACWLNVRVGGFFFSVAGLPLGSVSIVVLYAAGRLC